MEEGEYDDFIEDDLFEEGPEEYDENTNNNLKIREGTSEDKKKILQSVWEKTDDEVKAKIRTKTNKSRPKLTAIELTAADKGLPALKNLFDENHAQILKGNDPYEKLDLMMDKIECWAHNLYPKMNFDDCLEKIEKLGHTRTVKNMMKRLRLGISLENDDEEGGKQEDDEDKLDKEYDANMDEGGIKDKEEIKLNDDEATTSKVVRDFGYEISDEHLQHDNYSQKDSNENTDNSDSDVELAPKKAKKRKIYIEDDE